MKLISLNVGQPQIVQTPRGDLLTSIFKEAVDGRRRIAPHNVEGDRQADLTGHGGPKKAVYAYAQEHYAYWQETLPVASLTFGAFGENLTVTGLMESEIHIGDLLMLGTAKLRVTQPRMPCVKLAVRFGRPDMVKLFWQSNRSGVYFSVEEAGETGSGDEVSVVERNERAVSVADVVSLYKGENSDGDLYERALASPLAGSWRQGIQERWAAQ